MEAEAAENKAWREIFDKAKAYGYIVWENQEYVCHWGGLINPAAICTQEKVDPDADLNDFSAANRCTKAVKKALKDQERLSGKKAIYDTKPKLEDGVLVPDDDFAKALFIKMVNVRGQVKKMVDDHEACLAVLDKLKRYGDMDDIILGYLKMNYTEMLMKRRGSYVYNDKQGASQEFAVLSGKQNNYPDYYLFNRLLSMDDKESGEILAICEKLYNQKRKTDEGYDEMRVQLEALTERLKNNLEQLNEDWAEIEFDDGEAILRIYRSLCESAEAELLNFS